MLDGGGVCKGLEGRAGRPAGGGSVHLAGPKIGRPHHGAQLPGADIDHHNRTAMNTKAGEFADTGLERLFGDLLELRVEGGFEGCLGGMLLEDEVAEVRCAERLGIFPEGDGLVLGGPVLCGGDESVFAHAPKHGVPAPERATRIAVRAEAGRGLGQSHEHGRFGHAKVLGGLPEVALAGGFDPVEVAAERCAVDILFENLLLGEGGFEFAGVMGLDDFGPEIPGMRFGHLDHQRCEG